MSKFHVGSNGPAPCRASKRACPVGGEEVHFDNRDAAQQAYEKSMEEKHPVASLSKPEKVIQVSPEQLDGWATREELRAELGMSLIAFKHLEESGALPFRGPNNDLVLRKDIEAYKAKDSMNGFTRGEHEYEDVVIAFAQKPMGDDGKFPDSVKVLVPNVKKLTDKKRLEIGRQVWEFSGKDVEKWDQAPETERLRWSKTHMGRYGTTQVEVEDGSVSWVTDSTVAGNHSIENVKLIHD